MIILQVNFCTFGISNTGATNNMLFKAGNAMYLQLLL